MLCDDLLLDLFYLRWLGLTMVPVRGMLRFSTPSGTVRPLEERRSMFVLGA